MSDDEKQPTNPPKPCPAIWESIGGGSHACCALPDGHPGVHETARGTAFPPERTRICKPAECTPSAPSPSLRRFLIDLRGYDVTTSDGDVAADVARLDELLVQVRSDPSSPRQAMADASPRDLAAKVLTIIDRIDDYVPCDAHNAVCEIRALLTPHPTTNKEDSDG